jgi:3-oxoacyl-[acyl-carrier-protein] synthase-3
MGARIESVATARSRRGIFRRGGLRLSDEAARACLEQVHRDAGELDLLVNAGIYKERSMAEPALASIIQENIGANPGHPPRHGRHGTFSFDVENGGCGVLTAAHLVDAFVGAGTARLGLIVAADADPSPRTSRGFPFPPVGGALLLQHAGGDEGFVSFDFRTFPAFADAFDVRLRFDPRAAGLLRLRGRNVLEVHETRDFAGRCVECAAEVAHASLARAGISARDVDVLVTSQYPPTFGTDLARAVGVAADRVPRVAPDVARAHTAGPIVALEAAIESGRLASARHVLFVTAGAGITVGAAVYRR